MSVCQCRLSYQDVGGFRAAYVAPLGPAISEPQRTGLPLQLPSSKSWSPESKGLVVRWVLSFARAKFSRRPIGVAARSHGVEGFWGRPCELFELSRTKVHCDFLAGVVHMSTTANRELEPCISLSSHPSLKPYALTLKPCRYHADGSSRLVGSSCPGGTGECALDCRYILQICPLQIDAELAVQGPHFCILGSYCPCEVFNILTSSVLDIVMLLPLYLLVYSCCGSKKNALRELLAMLS